MLADAEHASKPAVVADPLVWRPARRRPPRRLLVFLFTVLAAIVLGGRTALSYYVEVVDAYDGTTTFYVFDAEDPIIFVLMTLPGEHATEFIEILPFTPANRNNLIEAQA